MYLWSILFQCLPLQLQLRARLPLQRHHCLGEPPRGPGLQAHALRRPRQHFQEPRPRLLQADPAVHHRPRARHGDVKALRPRQQVQRCLRKSNYGKNFENTFYEKCDTRTYFLPKEEESVGDLQISPDDSTSDVVNPDMVQVRMFIELWSLFHAT